jgi:hypothetical protein
MSRRKAKCDRKHTKLEIEMLEKAWVKNQKRRLKELKPTGQDADPVLARACADAMDPIHEDERLDDEEL